MGYRLKEICERLGGELRGDPDLVVRRLCVPEEMREGDLSVVFNTRTVASIQWPPRSAVIAALRAKVAHENLIRVADARQALIIVLDLFFPQPARPVGVDPRAAVSPCVQIRAEPYLAPGSFVGRRVVLGDRVSLHPNVYVGDDVRIGNDCELFPNVSIYAGTRMGDRVRIHSGTVIGSDGFGYARTETGRYRKIPQAGSVEIGNDVEIGANCAVDRATLGTTRIAVGTKIDNLVQIGHNSEIGEDCCIVAQVGISGSVRVGDRSLLAGQSGVSDHVTLAPGAIVGAQSGVKNDVGSGEWLGTPAVAADQARRIYSVWERLPQFRKEFLTVRKQCSELEERLKVLEAFLASGRPDP